MSGDEVLAELDRIADMAQTAIEKINTGQAVTGTSDLVKIKHVAEDTVRHAKAMHG